MTYTKSGNLTAVPAGSTNGTLIARDDDCNEIVFLLAAGESLAYAIQGGEAPKAAPASYTILGDNVKSWQEIVPPNVSIYITARSGAPKYRWLKNV